MSVKKKTGVKKPPSSKSWTTVHPNPSACPPDDTAILKLITRHAPDIIFVLDRSYHVCYINDQAARFVKRKPQEIIGRKFTELFKGSLGAEFQKSIERTFRTGARTVIERAADYPTGRTWIETHLVRAGEGKHNVVMGVSRLVNDRKKAEEALQSSEARYRIMFESVGTALAIDDGDTTIISTNREFEKLIGYKKKELEGKKTWTDFVHPEDLLWVKEYHYLRRANPEAVPKTFECRLIDKTGKVKNVLLNVDMIPGTAQTIASVFDITPLKKMQDEMRQGEGFLESVFASIQDGISVLDKDLHIIKVNPVMEKWHARSLPLVGKQCFAVYQGRDTVCEHCPSLRVLTTGQPAHETIPRRGPDGAENGWLDLYCFPHMDKATGKIKGVIEYVRDITRYKIAEETLQATEKRYQELWDNAPVAYHTVDKKGILTDVNQTELALLGYDKEEMIGRPIFDFIESTQRDEARERFELKIKGIPTPKSDNRIFVKRDGSQIYVSVNDVLDAGADGEVIGVRTTVVDVTQRKLMEEELKRNVFKLRKTMDDTIGVIAKIVEMRDPYTAGHQMRVAQLATAIAQQMDLPPERVENIRLAALLHDIGKINVPIEILSKPGRINQYEYEIIQMHPQIGYDIIKEMDIPQVIKQAILQHHERLSGTGYPLGLAEDKISEDAKILSVADVVEAMSSHRPYRPSLGRKEALAEIKKNRGTLYDPLVVDACLKVFKDDDFQFQRPQ